MAEPSTADRRELVDEDDDRRAPARAAAAAPHRIPGSSIPALTSLRFFAAFSVVLFHIVSSFAVAQLGAPLGTAGMPMSTGIGRQVVNVANAGSLGPNLFFVLSGFVLYWAYEATRRLTTDGRASFYVARVARLYPVYLAALAVGLVVVAADLITCRPDDLACTGGRGPGTALASVFMVQGWLPWNSASNGPAWTLSTELLFYLCFPLLVVLLRRASVTATWITLAIALIATQAWMVIALVGPDQPLVHDGSFAAGFWWWIHFAPLLRLPEFVAGLCLGRLFTLGRIPRFRPALVAVVVAGAALVVLYADKVLPRLGIGEPAMFANLGGLDAVFCLVIVALASSDIAFLGHRWLLLLGEASFALYIIHEPLWHVMAAVSPLDLRQRDSFLLWSVVYLVVLVVLAIVSFRLLETPARRGITRWWKQRSSTRA